MSEDIDFNSITGSSSFTDNYLTRNYIKEYLNDSVQQLLELKNTNPKIDVMEFFTEYFKSVLQGNHILFRDFNFVFSTPHNRACFIQKFFETYSHMTSRDDPINVNEFHALILLLSFDFPVDIIESALKIASNEENPLALFKDFIYLFQFQFYFKEFISDAFEIYNNIEKFIVKMNENRKNDDNKGQIKNFNLKSFSESLSLLIDQARYSVPPKNLIKEILSNKSDDFDFYKLLHELAFNEVIIKMIGKLPLPDKLPEYQANIAKRNEILIKETKDLSLDDKKNLLTSQKQTSLNRQKSFTNINNNMRKTVSDNSDRSSSCDSSSDTDT